MKLRQVQAVMVALSLLALTACGSADKKTDGIAGAGGASGDGVSTQGVIIEGAEGTNIDPDSIAGRAPADRTIYFEFDAAEVSSQYLALIAEHGRYLAQNSDGRVRLEGHTDERGTREYNVALGESRAKAVARMLQLQGVSSAQFRAVSYGEELPVDEGHSPAAWDKNRRVQIVYETE